MLKETMPEEFGQMITNSVIEGNKTFNRKLRLEKNSEDLDLFKNYMRLRREHIDTRLKRDWRKGKIPFDAEIHHKTNGFHEYNEYICNTTYGETLFIIKSRPTLLQGIEADVDHLKNYAKENTLIVDDSLDLLDELVGPISKKSSSESQRAIFIICYDVDSITNQINYLGLYTLGASVSAVEVQNFSHCIDKAYNIDEGGVIKNDTPPTSPEDYNLALRKQEKKNE